MITVYQAIQQRDGSISKNEQLERAMATQQSRIKTLSAIVKQSKRNWEDILETIHKAEYRFVTNMTDTLDRWVYPKALTKLGPSFQQNEIVIQFTCPSFLSILVR